MLEKILKSKETKKLTKNEQKNILGGEFAEEQNCDKAVAEEYYAC